MTPRLLITAFVALAALPAAGQPVPALDFCTPPAALTDLAGGTYCGLAGGLYGGTNAMPAAHAAEGAAETARVRPLDAAGQPAATGRVVVLSVGMSNATQEWCGPNTTGAAGATPCNPWTFKGRADADAGVDHAALAVANGAMGGQALNYWDSPNESNYDRVRDAVLAPDGLTEAQVQAVWLKAALLNEPSRPGLPAANADAYALERAIGDVLRALRVRYPNLRLVFVTSRIFSYARAGVGNSPEPYAYETGFGTRAAIEAQIRQRGGAGADPVAGDLGPAAAPWVAWGPYLWAPGDSARADGLQWTRDLFQSDGVHPNTAGETIVADSLLAFFKTSPFTRPWFVAGATAAEAAPGAAGVRLVVWPTPARGAAAVRLSLDAPARVDVTLIDALGRIVARLAEGEHTAGDVALSLPAGLAPGIYVVRAVVGDQAVSRTVTVVR